MTRSNPLAIAATLALSLATVACNRDAEPEVDLNDTATVDTTPIAGEFRVTDVSLGRGMQGDSALRDETDDFGRADTIHALVRHEGSGSGTRITARWTFEDGQVVDERTETVSPSGTGAAYTHFTISKPDGWPAGTYTLHLLVNDREVETETFEVGDD
jgi:hypothetical protein